MLNRFCLVFVLICMGILGSFSATLEDLQNQAHVVAGEKSPCPPSYAYNPFLNKCIRLVTEGRNWLDAYNYCQAAGETMLVLDTVQSVNWFNNLRRTDEEWKSAGWLWIGGRRFDNQWFWFGKVVARIYQQDWEDPVQPDFTPSMDCLQVFDNDRLYKWDNWDCDLPQAFVCEQDAPDQGTGN